MNFKLYSSSSDEQFSTDKIIICTNMNEKDSEWVSQKEKEWEVGPYRLI